MYMYHTHSLSAVPGHHCDDWRQQCRCVGWRKQRNHWLRHWFLHHRQMVPWSWCWLLHSKHTKKHILFLVKAMTPKAANLIVKVHSKATHFPHPCPHCFMPPTSTTCIIMLQSVNAVKSHYHLFAKCHVLTDLRIHAVANAKVKERWADFVGFNDFAEKIHITWYDQ